AVVGGVAVGVGGAGVGRVSFWLDEAATVSMVRRGYSELWWAVSEHLDLVHGLYYLLMKVWGGWFGVSEISLRVPSVLATGVAAAGVVVVGRRCGGEAVGVLAGFVYVASVPVSRYAQEARPYALVTAVAVLATYAFLRIVADDGRRWVVLYGALVLVVGLLNVFALLLVVAHAITLLIARPTARTVSAWWLAAGTALAALVPFILAVSGQREQISRIPPARLGDLPDAALFLAGGPVPLALFAPLILLAVLSPKGREHMPARENRGGLGVRGVAGVWAAVPGLVLVGVSMVGTPVYRERYLVFCLPAVALLVGSGLARLGRVRVVAGVVAGMVLVAVPGQVRIREADERNDDLRTPARILGELGRAGDGIVFVKPQMRWRAAAYAEGYAGLADLMQLVSPVEAGDLVGVDVDLAELRLRLRGMRRVWVIQDAEPWGLPRWAEARLRVVRTHGPSTVAGEWNYPGGRLTLLTRLP
ncbi:glycosyltransferase family 39 protein, partial [Actinocorallia lasiicapitis]